MKDDLIFEKVIVSSFIGAVVFCTFLFGCVFLSGATFGQRCAKVYEDPREYEACLKRLRTGGEI